MPYVKRVPKTFTDEQIVEELRKATRESSQTAVAKEIGVSMAYISEVLKGRRPLGPKVLEYLGYRREVSIRKIA